MAVMTLAQLLAKGKMNKRSQDELISGLCDELMRIHASDGVYKYISPENVLIDNEGKVSLRDLSLMHISPDDYPREYISPEVWMERINDIDARSDVFSLGRVIFEVSDRFTSISLKCMSPDKSRRYGDVQQVKEKVLRKSRSHLGLIIAVLLLAASVAVSGYLFSGR